MHSNTFFCNIASDICFADKIVSAHDAIPRHRNHPSILQINEHFEGQINQFRFKYVNKSEVDKKLTSLEPRKATGYDGITGKLLRIAHSGLSGPLTMLINTCISQKHFPEVAKCDKVSPLYKIEDVLRMNNYRPVSVLTSLSKTFESLLHDQLLVHFCGLLNERICAYRKGYSCQTLLLKLLDDWKQSLDKNHVVGVLFMDLSKAFHSLPQALLIAKLHADDLTEDACELVASFLTNRKQRVKVNDVKSSWGSLIDKGFPEDSILGPILLNIHMNDLFLFIKKVCAL